MSEQWPDDPVFARYRVVFHYDEGEGTEPQWTSLMRPWLYKADPGEAVVRAEAEAAWPRINWRGAPRARRLLRVEIERKPDVPWALAWFSHQTFRVGRTDDELRESFGRYVARYADRQHDVNAPAYVCLMGAEDHWRWRDICACESCVTNDVAIIAH